MDICQVDRAGVMLKNYHSWNCCSCITMTIIAMAVTVATFAAAWIVVAITSLLICYKLVSDDISYVVVVFGLVVFVFVVFVKVVVYVVLTLDLF